jgi:hypothetical protein
VKVSCRNAIFEQTSEESSYLRSEICKILHIDLSLVKHIRVTSARTFVINFAKSVTKTSIRKYTSTIKSTTITSHTGQTTSVVSTSYTKTSSHTSKTELQSYRTCQISVRKSIFEQTTQEESFLKNEIAQKLNIQKTLIKNIHILTGKKVRLEFERKVSRRDVESYVERIRSYRLTSRTGKTSAVTTVKRSSTTKTTSKLQHKVSSEVKVEVMSAVLHKSAAEEDNLRASFARLFNIQSNRILQVKVLNNREAVLKFDKSVKRQHIEQRLTYAQNGFISSASGQQSMVMETRLTGSTQKSTTDKKVTVKTDESVFKQSTTEMEYLREEMAKKFHVSKKDISRVEIMNGKKIEVYFKKNIKKSQITKEFRHVKTSTITSSSGSSTSVSSTSYSKVRNTVSKHVSQVTKNHYKEETTKQEQSSQTQTSQTSQTVQTSTSSSGTVKVTVQRNIFKQSTTEQSHLRTEFSRLFNCKTSQITKVRVESNKQVSIDFSKSFSKSSIQSRLGIVESSTVTSNSGASSTVTSATYSSSSASSAQSSHATSITVSHAVFETTAKEITHFTRVFAKIFKVKTSQITQLKFISNTRAVCYFSSSVSKSVIQTGLKALRQNRLTSYYGKTSSVTSARYIDTSSTSTTTSTSTNTAVRYARQFRNVRNTQSSFCGVAVSKKVFKFTNKETTYLRNYFTRTFKLSKTAIRKVEIVSPRDCRIVFDRSVSAQRAARLVKGLEKTTIKSVSGQTATVQLCYFVATQLVVQTAQRILRLSNAESKFQIRRLSRTFRVKQSRFQKMEIISPNECIIYLPVNVPQATIATFKSTGLKSVSGKTSAIRSVQTATATSTQLVINVDKNALSTTSRQEVQSLTTQVASVCSVASSAVASLSVMSQSSIFSSFSSAISYSTLSSITSTSTTITSISNVQCVIQSTSVVGSITQTVGVDSGSLVQTYSSSFSSSSSSFSQSFSKFSQSSGNAAPKNPNSAGGFFGCFAGSARVKTPTGYRRMDQLTTGDLVETSAGYMTLYNQLDIWLHHDSHLRSPFLNIRTVSNRSLVLTDKHLIPLFQDCLLPEYPKIHWVNSTFKLTRTADQARPGMCVGVRTASGALQMDAIRSIQREFHTGVYAPVLEEGFLFVEDVFVSCWSDVGSGGERYYAVNSFIWLSRAFYNAVATLLSSILRLALPDWATAAPELYYQFNRVCDIFY